MKNMDYPMSKFKYILYKYRHGALLSYILLYFAWFFTLEEHVYPIFWVRSWIDDYIPFCEWFVIPYLLWFFYVAAAIAYFFFTSPKEYNSLCTFLFTGMTLCLIIYTILPNGQHLRPMYFTRDNILVDAVKILYSSDTPTNVCPSIHCLNSVGVHIAILHSKIKSRWIRFGSAILCVSICLSTMFLKQHSIIDVIAALILCVPLYMLAYRFVPASNTQRRLAQAHEHQ